MGGIFSYASTFNQDLSKWDVSAATNMVYMFSDASAFNQDLSKWDVSAVTDMKFMFDAASAFKQDLCGAAWVNSKADKGSYKREMFTGSSGSISSTVCTTTRPGYGEGYG